MRILNAIHRHKADVVAIVLVFIPGLPSPTKSSILRYLYSTPIAKRLYFAKVNSLKAIGFTLMVGAIKVLVISNIIDLYIKPSVVKNEGRG